MNSHSTEYKGILRVSGADAKKLLQGQLTCNLDEITSQHSSLAAHCNPQGRIISLSRIMNYDNEYYLCMPRELIPIALLALKKYAVFYKVILEDISDDVSHLEKLALLDKNWHALEIAAGIPSIYPETSEKFLPHEINLHKLDAISFNKGCYTGQEIIARMQYRGKLKTHMYRMQSPHEPKRNGEIFNKTRVIGNIVDYVEISYNTYELLAVASETEIDSTPLFLDAERTLILELLALPYSLK